MIHTYVTSRIDNGNCLLYGISDHLLTKLQSTKRCSFNRSSLASYQTADRVQIVTVDVSKPSWTSCIIHNLPTNSLRTDPCATLRGRSPTRGSTMQTTYAGRKGIYDCCSTPLEQSAACHARHRLPQFFQEATEDISV